MSSIFDSSRYEWLWFRNGTTYLKFIRTLEATMTGHAPPKFGTVLSTQLRKRVGPKGVPLKRDEKIIES